MSGLFCFTNSASNGSRKRREFIFQEIIFIISELRLVVEKIMEQHRQYEDRLRVERDLFLLHALQIHHLWFSAMFETFHHHLLLFFLSAKMPSFLKCRYV